MIAPDRGRGFTLVEVAVVVVLLGLIISWGGLLVGSFRRSAEKAVRMTERIQAVRTARSVLDEELRRGRVHGRATLNSEGELSLRAFRWTGVVCEAGMEGREGTERRFEVWGTRAPDPGKDSVLVLAPDGTWRAAELAWITSTTPCEEGGGPAIQVALRPAADDGVLLRGFERGRYGISNGAFRYRRGGGGRQPLTPERFQSGRLLEAAGGMWLEAVMVPDLPGERAWTEAWFIPGMMEPGG
jgi:prepilin-type N-terminal cleavage/methylation domain-containing protein